MTDMTPDGLPDTPGPEATPEQEAWVRALLGTLNDEPSPIPDDVARRLDAVLLEAEGAGAVPSSAPSAAGPPDDPSGTVTVLPAGPRAARATSRRARLLGGLAAVAVVVLGGVVASGALRGGGTTAGTSSLASGGSTAEATRITASGASYSAAGLPSQATALVTAARSAADGTASAEASPPPADAAMRAALSPAAVAACVRQLTQGDGSVALAADTGSYQGRPALVVVIPTQGDPSTLDVWVVAPTCSATSADLLEFQRIPAP